MLPCFDPLLSINKWQHSAWSPTSVNSWSSAFQSVHDHLGPSYNNTMSHIILTVTTHKYTSLSLLIILAHWMASFSALLTLNTGWQQPFYSGVRTKSDSFSRSQGSEAPD